MNLILIAVFAASVCLVNGQSCQTPSGGNGDCISIYSCQPLMKLIQNPNRTSQDVDLLKKSHCGFKDGKPTVCCPKTQPQGTPCYTPEGSAGQCISIYSCPHLANKLKPPVLDKNIAYVQNSRCNGTEKYAVCCGPATDTDTGLTIGNCANRMTAFPPDPRSECCGVDTTARNKIVGGKLASIEHHPWMVIIEYEKAGVTKLLCGGVLISGRYVMTAAHCVVGPVLNVGTPTRVRLGEHDISRDGIDCVPLEFTDAYCSDGETRISIKNIISHPEYNPGSSQKTNDIALLRLKELAPFRDLIRPICLPTKDLTLPQNTPANFFLYVSGWAINSLDQLPNKVKQHVDLPFVSPEECQLAYSKPGRTVDLWKGQLCAGGQPGNDTCKGDSGGPLMFENNRTYQLIGIASFGSKPCGLEGVPVVYTKVFEYLDWIKRTIVA